MSWHWDHHFCLTCDTQTDGSTYCSEPCRLADFETSTAPSTPSPASSPSTTFLVSSTTALMSSVREQHQQQPRQSERRSTAPPSNSSLSGSRSAHLPPSLARARPVAPLPRHPWTCDARSYFSPPPAAARPHVLSPSSSRTSLSSIRSTASSTSGTAMVSEKAAKELREYARSFESVRSLRRRSQ